MKKSYYAIVISVFCIANSMDKDSVSLVVYCTDSDMDSNEGFIIVPRQQETNPISFPHVLHIPTIPPALQDPATESEPLALYNEEEIKQKETKQNAHPHPIRMDINPNFEIIPDEEKDPSCFELGHACVSCCCFCCCHSLVKKSIIKRILSTPGKDEPHKHYQ